MRRRRQQRGWRRAACFVALSCIVITLPLTLCDSVTSTRSYQQSSAETPDVSDPDVLVLQGDNLRREQTADAYQKALEKFRAAAALSVDRKRFELAARSFRSAGEIYQLLGNLTEAIESFDQAKKWSAAAHSQAEEARALNGLASAHFLRGDAQAAHEASTKALQVAKLIKDQTIEAAALSNLGESFYSLGDLDKAQKYQQEALELFTALGDFQGRSCAQVALGYYSASSSEPKLALSYLQQGLESAKQANDLRSEVLALNALGNVKSKFGRKQEALDAYNEASPLAQRLGDQLFLASIIGGLGSLHYSLGDTSTALELHRQATDLFEQLNATWGVAEGKLDIGRIENSIGHSEDALKHSSEALTLFRSLKMRRLEVQSLREIGVAFTATNEFDKALKAFEEARKLARAGQDLRHEANALNLIGRLYEKQHQVQKAFEYYGQALTVSRQAADPASESAALFNLARLERDRKNLADATNLAETAIGISESIRSMVSSHELRASYFASVHQIYELYADIMMLTSKSNPGGGFDQKALATSEKARARSLLDSLQDGQTDVRAGVDPKLLEKERELGEELNAKAERHMKLLSVGASGEAEKAKRDIDLLTVEYSSVRDQIRASGSRYAALVLPEPLTLSQIQQRLVDERTVLLEYLLGDDRSYVWLITKNDLSAYELPGRTEIESAARNLYSQFVAHQSVSGETAEQSQTRLSKANESLPIEISQLSRLVLAPVAGKLENKRLVIIPDGALQYIPFQTLNDPDSSSPQPLIKNHEIVYEPSASTLAVLQNEAQQRNAAPNSVAVLADPVFEVDDPRVKRASTESTPESEESRQVKKALRDIGISTDGIAIPRLYASSKEADAIIRYAPWGTSLKAVGFEANRARIVGPELSQYRVVHFATHGLINNEHPELSGIVFSLFDQQGRSQDGFLRLHDIYNLHLPADLVVLSACSTGLGKDVRGEGLISLTRGFMYAGASGVVASLWKVDDDATAELMKVFYEGMFKKGLSPAAALRDAQLTMSQQKVWQSPYYWAGFVIQGRYDETVSGNQLSYLTTRKIVLAGIVILSLLLLLIVVLHRRRRSAI